MTSCSMYSTRTDYKVEKLKGKEVKIFKMPDVYKNINNNAQLDEYVNLLCQCLKIRYIQVFDLDYSDISIVPTIAMFWEHYVSYSSPIFDISTYFVIRAARPTDKFISLIKPFSLNIWICVSITTVLFVYIIYAVLKREAQIFDKEHPKFSTLCWMLMRNAFRQDTEINHIILRTFRILIGCWILAVFVLTSAYTGVLPSYLIYPGSEKIPKNFVELAQSVKDGNYNVSMTFCSDEEAIFLITGRKLPAILQIFSKNIEENPNNRVILGKGNELQKVLDGTDALLATKLRIDPLTMKFRKENFYVSPDSLFTNFRFLQINKLRLYQQREVFEMINILHQSGLSLKLQQDIIEEDRRYYEFNFYDDKGDEESLKVEDLKGPLILLILGYILSFLVFIGEIFIGKFKKKVILTII
ncbi:glutamate receptor ionotropic, kainate 1-like [Centruroides vittatus]|uniref:glutamate receptor ionotropic, kainate 1-like n=1 Tax=Centruroides vittatus TaxID=120091 RepID=UPI0035109DF2